MLHRVSPAASPVTACGIPEVGLRLWPFQSSSSIRA